MLGTVDMIHSSEKSFEKLLSDVSVPRRGDVGEGRRNHLAENGLDDGVSNSPNLLTRRPTMVQRVPIAILDKLNSESSCQSSGFRLCSYGEREHSTRCVLLSLRRARASAEAPREPET